MKIRAEQISEHLRKGLAPMYMVYGDEPLLVQETCDAVRAAARGQGYDERVVMDVDAGFDWEALRHLSDNLSLFTQRRLVDLRLHGGKPGQAGAKVLAELAARPPQDTLLLVSSGRLEKSAYTSQWFKARGTARRHRPAVAGDPGSPAWLDRRAHARQGHARRPRGRALIAAYTEGNLLAAVQEIEKLHLLYGGEPINAEQAAAAVTESARFNIYDLGEAALAGDVARVVRIVNALRGEGVAPPLVLWALVQEARTFYLMSWQLAGGANMEQVLATQRISRDKRAVLARQALKRYPRGPLAGTAAARRPRGAGDQGPAGGQCLG